MGIKTAKKVERITEVTIESYEGTLTVSEDHYNVGKRDINVRATDPRVELLDTMLAFTTPSEDECPPREVTLQTVIDELQRRRDLLDSKYDPDGVLPLNIRFSLDQEEVAVLSSVLGKGDISYDVNKTVAAALNPDTKTW